MNTVSLTLHYIISLLLYYNADLVHEDLMRNSVHEREACCWTVNSAILCYGVTRNTIFVFNVLKQNDLYSTLGDSRKLYFENNRSHWRLVVLTKMREILTKLNVAKTHKIKVLKTSICIINPS